MKLTIQDVDEGYGHDQDAYEHVSHGQRPQEEVSGVLQLLLQGHGQDHQDVATDGQRNDDQYEQRRPVLLLHRRPGDGALGEVVHPGAHGRSAHASASSEAQTQRQGLVEVQGVVAQPGHSTPGLQGRGGGAEAAQQGPRCSVHSRGPLLVEVSAEAAISPLLRRVFYKFCSG